MINSKLDLSRKISKNAILSIVFTLLIVTVLVAYILSIINIVWISSTDWENHELNESKNGFTIGSIICIILFTPFIPSIISLFWSNKCKNTLEAKVVK